MIRLICFDLDGVLVDSKETHFKALNMALTELGGEFVISYEEHIKKYDGLPTKRKLGMLHAEKGLPKDKFEEVWRRKQELTSSVVAEFVKPNPEICDLFRSLHESGVKIFVCSNSIRQTTKMYLLKLGLMEWVDEYISNEDVASPKPNPSMYIKAMLMANAEPRETLVVEDSHHGVKAAMLSGAKVMVVSGPQEVTKSAVTAEIERHSSSKPMPWKHKKMNVLIPMAGGGEPIRQGRLRVPEAAHRGERQADDPGRC